MCCGLPASVDDGAVRLEVGRPVDDARQLDDLLDAAQVAAQRPVHRRQQPQARATRKQLRLLRRVQRGHSAQSAWIEKVLEMSSQHF